MKLTKILRLISPKIKHVDNLRGVAGIGSLIGFFLAFIPGLSYLGYSSQLNELRTESTNSIQKTENIRYLENEVEKNKKSAKRSLYLIIPSIALGFYADKRYKECRDISGMNHEFADRQVIWDYIKDIPVEEYIYEAKH